MTDIIDWQEALTTKWNILEPKELAQKIVDEMWQIQTDTHSNEYYQYQDNLGWQQDCLAAQQMVVRDAKYGIENHTKRLESHKETLVNTLTEMLDEMVRIKEYETFKTIAEQSEGYEEER